MHLSLSSARWLVRDPKAVTGNLASERNRTLQLLTSANIELASIMGDVFGASARMTLQALAEGRAAPAEMADLAKSRFRREVGQLAEDNSAVFPPADRFAMALNGYLAETEIAICAAMRPFAAQQACLATIPGLDELTAASVTAVDRRRHGDVQNGPAPHGLGWRSPGQPRERGQAEAVRHPQSQYVPRNGW